MALPNSTSGEAYWNEWMTYSGSMPGGAMRLPDCARLQGARCG